MAIQENKLTNDEVKTLQTLKANTETLTKEFGLIRANKWWKAKGL